MANLRRAGARLATEPRTSRPLAPCFLTLDAGNLEAGIVATAFELSSKWLTLADHFSHWRFRACRLHVVGLSGTNPKFGLHGDYLAYMPIASLAGALLEEHFGCEFVGESVDIWNRVVSCGYEGLAKWQMRQELMRAVAGEGMTISVVKPGPFGQPIAVAERVSTDPSFVSEVIAPYLEEFEALPRIDSFVVPDPWSISIDTCLFFAGIPPTGPANSSPRITTQNDDGPITGDRFVFNGVSHEMSRKLWMLLDQMWGRDARDSLEVQEEVWGSVPENDETLKSALRELNKKLKEVGFTKRLSKARGANRITWEKISNP